MKSTHCFTSCRRAGGKCAGDSVPPERRDYAEEAECLLPGSDGKYQSQVRLPEIGKAEGSTALPPTSSVSECSLACLKKVVQGWDKWYFYVELAQVSASHLREFGLKKWVQSGTGFADSVPLFRLAFSGGTAQSHGWLVVPFVPIPPQKNRKEMKMAKRDAKSKG